MATGWIEAARSARKCTIKKQRIRTTSGFESTSCAVVFAGAVEQRRIVIDESARGGQRLAARAEVDIALVVIGEVVA